MLITFCRSTLVERRATKLQTLSLCTSKSPTSRYYSFNTDKERAVRNFPEGSLAQWRRKTRVLTWTLSEMWSSFTRRLI